MGDGMCSCMEKSSRMARALSFIALTHCPLHRTTKFLSNVENLNFRIHLRLI